MTYLATPHNKLFQIRRSPQKVTQYSEVIAQHTTVQKQGFQVFEHGEFNWSYNWFHLKSRHNFINRSAVIVIVLRCLAYRSRDC